MRILVTLLAILGVMAGLAAYHNCDSERLSADVRHDSVSEQANGSAVANVSDAPQTQARDDQPKTVVSAKPIHTTAIHQTLMAKAPGAPSVDLPAYRGSQEMTPAGSFLVYRSSTVEELRDQVANNPLVKSRYAKHFGVSAAELDSAFANDLQLVSLKKPMRTQCWYIDRAGKSLVKSKLLPRGSMVFATRSGVPLLAWSCGNPLRARLPKIVTKVKGEAPETVAGKPVEKKVLANPMEIVSTAVVTAPPAPALMSAVPVAAAPVILSAAAPAVSAPPIAGAAGALGALGALGGIAIQSHHSNYVVPEPASLVVLAGALCAVPGLCKIRRRRK